MKPKSERGSQRERESIKEPKEKRGFPELLEAIDSGWCSACGACLAFCNRGVIGFEEKPTALDLEACNDCGNCFFVCPRIDYVSKNEEWDKIYSLRPEGELHDVLVGGFLGIYKGRASVPVSQKQDGGAVTAILVSLLQSGEIDGALLAGASSSWVAEPVIATTEEEIIAAAGSKYTLSPTLTVLKEAVSKRKLRNLAIVGTPCQITAARRIQNSKFKRQARSIKILIGLFCTEVFSHKILEELVVSDQEIPLEDIKKFDIKGKFVIQTSDGEAFYIPLETTKDYMLQGCHPCVDFTAEWADISAGAVGTKGAWTTLLPRTEIGLKSLEIAATAELMELKKVGEGALRLPKVLTTEKRERAKNFVS